MVDSSQRSSAESNSTISRSGLPHETQASRLQWARLGVLGILGVTVAIAYLTRHCMAVANTTMQSELQFNNEQFGYLYSAFSMGYLICQVPGGWLGQRLGTRSSLALLCCIWSMMTLATGLVTSLTALIVARLGFGFAQAGLIPNQAQVIHDWFAETSRGSASAVIVTAMSVGGFGALWLTARLLNVCHWRTLFISYGMIGIVWSILMFLLFRSQPQQVTWLGLSTSPESIESASPELIETEARQTSRSQAGWETFWSILRSVSFWALFTQMIFKAAGYNLLVTFLPTYLELAHQISATRAGELTSWSLIAVVIGSLFGGWLIDRLQRLTGSRKISRVGVAVVSLVSTAVLMGVSCYAQSVEQVAMLIAASSIMMGIAGPCAWAATIDVGGQNTAVVMGFLNMGGAIPGIIISPLVGRLIDSIKAGHGNWNWVILVHALFYLIAAGCWLLVNLESTPQARETTNAV